MQNLTTSWSIIPQHIMHWSLIPGWHIHHGIWHAAALMLSSSAGPTVVVDQQHCSSAQQEDTPRRSLLVYPRKNNFLLFDSRLGHGVLDTLSEGLRMTVLINWWHHKPMVSWSCRSLYCCLLYSAGHLRPTLLITLWHQVPVVQEQSLVLLPESCRVKLLS